MFTADKSRALCSDKHLNSIRQFRHYLSASVIIVAVILLAYASLIIGVVKKTYILVIPYFTICILFVFMFSMKLIVDILDLISETKQQNSSHLVEVVAESLLISFEIYSMVVVWRILNYIMDYQMQEEFFFALRPNRTVRHATVIESGDNESGDSDVDDVEHNMRHAFVLWKSDERTTVEPRTTVTTICDDDDDDTDFSSV
ncbi:unnamed protein product [Anisakis simplex]|uniref:Transmembrane protein 237 n=1 Tax=Anisakis simplex TaxID=6269 RepID=A0A0M3JXE4_ANISI|nr:unnamed protein product [Anisakis simplex]